MMAPEATHDVEPTTLEPNTTMGALTALDLDGMVAFRDAFGNTVAGTLRWVDHYCPSGPWTRVGLEPGDRRVAVPSQTPCQVEEVSA
jgi:hypothetical protein